MTETIKQVADRLGITPAELERRIDEAQAAIRRNTASPCFGGHETTEAATVMPSGYKKPGTHKLRLPDEHARAMGETRALWVKPGKGRPAVESPLEKAVAAEEKRARVRGCHSLRAESAKCASKAAGEKRAAKGKLVAALVESLAAKGKSTHRIARATKKTSHRVRQILAASKRRKSP